MDMQAESIMIGIIMSFIGIILVIAISVYVILAIALYKLAKNNGYEDVAFLGWIPLANVYLIGLLGGDGEFAGHEFNDKTAGLIAVFAPIVLGILSFIPLIGMFAGLATLAITAYMYYRIFLRINPDSALGLGIANAIIGFVGAIYLFIHRNDIFLDLIDNNQNYENNIYNEGYEMENSPNQYDNDRYENSSKVNLKKDVIYPQMDEYPHKEQDNKNYKDIQSQVSNEQNYPYEQKENSDIYYTNEDEKYK